MVFLWFSHYFPMVFLLEPDFQGPLRKGVSLQSMGPMKTLQQSWLSSEAWGHDDWMSWGYPMGLTSTWPWKRPQKKEGFNGKIPW